MSRSSPERKGQIIAAALELFREKGFADVSTRDLAEHAGLSRSHIYHYFGDWNELRREAFVHFADEQLKEAGARLTDKPPVEALLGLSATACRRAKMMVGVCGWMPGTRPCTTQNSRARLSK